MNAKLRTRNLSRIRGIIRFLNGWQSTNEYLFNGGRL